MALTKKDKLRFDLEDAIMSAWQTENDLEIIVATLYEEPKIDNDKFYHLVFGLKELHAARMNKLFSIFEDLAQEMHNTNRTPTEDLFADWTWEEHDHSEK